MRKLKYFIIYLLLIPVIVSAGGSSDDTTYNTELEAGYTYGNVKKCNSATGIAYFEGIKKVTHGNSVCLWNAKDKMKIETLTCEDSSMDSFLLETVTGSDGVEYYGYGCRKAEDENKIKYETLQMTLGNEMQFASYTTHTCSILSGDAGEYDKNNSCYFRATKVGVIRIKIKKDKGLNATYESKYYEIHVTERNSTLSDLDNNYYYGSVGECNLKVGGKVSFENLLFCGSSAPGFTYDGINKLTCAEEGYEPFKLEFTSNGYYYKGWGCRKPKNESSINYIEKELYIGYGSQVASQYSNKCTIIDGDSGEFDDMNACYFNALKTGETKIKVVHNTTSETTYYKYIVKEPLYENVELDTNYYYTNVSTCELRDGAYSSGGYNLGNKVQFQGYDFCVSSLPGFNFNTVNVNVTCDKNKYELFTITFSKDNKNYKGYGCRILKSDVDNQKNEYKQALDYNSICSNATAGNRGIRQTFKMVGYLIQIIKWIVPLIIIVLGMVDFGKAAISNDEKAINKALFALVRRLLAGIVIFFIPTIVMAILNAIEVYKGLDENFIDPITNEVVESQFGACTKCLFDPYNSCEIKND